MMIVEFLWYLESTVHDTNGWEISLALSSEERGNILRDTLPLIRWCSNCEHKQDHDILSSVSVGVIDPCCCCCRNE